MRSDTDTDTYIDTDTDTDTNTDTVTEFCGAHGGTGWDPVISKGVVHVLHAPAEALTALFCTVRGPLLRMCGCMLQAIWHNSRHTAVKIRHGTAPLAGCHMAAWGLTSQALLGVALLFVIAMCLFVATLTWALDAH
jgi:hypothetical protein